MTEVSWLAKLLLGTTLLMMAMTSCSNNTESESYTIHQQVSATSQMVNEQEVSGGHQNYEMQRGAQKGSWQTDFNFDEHVGWREQTQFGDGTNKTMQTNGSPYEHRYKANITTPEGQAYEWDVQDGQVVDERRVK